MRTADMLNKRRKILSSLGFISGDEAKVVYQGL